MAKAVMARRTGIFRCSGIGQTVSARAGETLPKHSTCKGGCEWEFKAKDNPHPSKPSVLIGEGPIYCLLITVEAPQVGDIITLTGDLNGNFRVTKLDKIERPDIERIWPRILVKRANENQSGMEYRVARVRLPNSKKPATP